MASDVPDVYTDSVRIHVNGFGASITFSLTPPGEPSGEAQPVANVRLSLEHAKVLAIILKKQLKNYEDGNKEPIVLHPALWKNLGLSKQEDW
jgi:hypothetical protein